MQITRLHHAEIFVFIDCFASTILFVIFLIHPELLFHAQFSNRVNILCIAFIPKYLLIINFKEFHN